MKQLPILVLKGCPFVGASLYSLRVPSGFGGRAGSDVNMSLIFPQGVLAAIILVRGGAGGGGAKARAKCEPGLLLCLVTNSALLGARLGPKLLEKP